MKTIRSIKDLSFIAKQTSHVLTLFSGGLDSTYLLEVLSKLSIKVTALAVDLGDGIDQAKLSLITEHYGVDLVVVDARQEFVEKAVVPAIQAQARYLNMFPVSSFLSRPIIVDCALNAAERLGCDAIIHTANQSQNSLRRLNGAIQRSDFKGFYGTPYEYSVITREEKIEGLSLSGLHEFSKRNVSGDSNLWCREYESGVLDNPEDFNIPESLFQWSREKPAVQFVDTNHQVRITFQEGLPVAINDKSMSLLELIDCLNVRGGA